MKSGVTVYDWQAGQEFFESFGNSDILGADIEVEAKVNNHGLTIDVDCSISGTVTVACDRCLGDLDMPVDTSFSESYSPEGGELDLGQDIYDYVCISLPLQRMHPDGECDQETTRYLSK